MKGGRRKAREDALQILYQLDLNHGLATSSAMGYFESFYSQKSEVDDFTRRLVSGVSNHLKELDDHVERVSDHWRMDRMAIVDRNILRIGVYELCYCDDIPTTVSINEMIEVAKQFGSENSAAFINGILDKVKGNLHRPAKAP